MVDQILSPSRKLVINLDALHLGRGQRLLLVLHVLVLVGSRLAYSADLPLFSVYTFGLVFRRFPQKRVKTHWLARLMPAWVTFI